ncbi:MAG TPA: ParA family protein [Acidimicrobiales bacterium]|nr:ParA family protein [Acidimicrobiales bacterium]
MNIVVSNVKGGVGKTTTAVYLAAVAAERNRGPVTLVDADPQGSTAEWYDTDPLEGVELVEGPSVRTVSKAMSQDDGIVVVDTPPGEGTVVQAALGKADAVVIPTRAGGVEPNRVFTTLEMTPRNVPAGVVVCSARLGTNDLEATIEWWTDLKVPVWGIVPERVSIASGPAAALSSEGLEYYGKVFKKATVKPREPR